MNKIKIYISMIILVLSCLLLGCQRIQNIRNGITVFSDCGDYQNTIKELFKQRNVDGLYEYFSQNAKEDKNLYSRLKMIITFWDMLELDDTEEQFFNEGGTKTIENGEITRFDSSFSLEHYYDRYGNEYRISFWGMYKDTQHPEKEGIYDIQIISDAYIYSTSVDEKDKKLCLSNIDDFDVRARKVFNDLLSLRDDSNYISSDDKERIAIVRDSLYSISKADNNKYSSPIIITDTISLKENVVKSKPESLIGFNFCDGSRFVVGVHNNP